MTTLQELLNAGVTGIINQGGPAWNTDTKTCRYRHTAPDGTVRKCMIGWSIADDVYDKELETETWSLFERFWPELNPEDVASLQGVHDSVVLNHGTIPDPEFFVYFRAQVQDFVADYGLTMPNVRWPDDEQVD